MHSEELKTQLVRVTQEKNQSVELAKVALMNGAETFRKDLSESASSFRNDLRDELKKAREEWAETTKAETARREEASKAERRRWEDAAKQAEERLSETKRKLWLWGPLSLLGVALFTAALTVGLTLWLTSKGTTLALGTLQQTAAAEVADLRSQVETAKVQLNAAQMQISTSKAELAQIAAKITKEQERLETEKAKTARLTTFPARNGGIFVEVEDRAQSQIYEGRTIILAKTTPAP